MRCYSLVSSLLTQDCNVSTDVKPTKKNPIKTSWIPLLDEWIKINMDILRRHNIGSTIIVYIVKDKHTNSIMATEKINM